MSPLPSARASPVKRGESVSPTFPGVTSAAHTAEAIESQARDALATAIEAMRAGGQALPTAVEETGLPAYDLADYDHPLVLLIACPELAEAA